MSNVHIKARKSPYSGTNDVQVKFEYLFETNRRIVLFRDYPFLMKRFLGMSNGRITIQRNIQHLKYRNNLSGLIIPIRMKEKLRSKRKISFCYRKTIKNFNTLDGKTDRTSLTGDYDLDKETNRPKNPQGRTGRMKNKIFLEWKRPVLFCLVSGRGLLGRWGPNHAGDPVVTRWAKDADKKVLEIILIKRRDTGERALPGGMVDAG